MKNVVVKILKLYKKYISAFLPPACRFVPTCSEYTAIAVERYGIIKGFGLGVKRILRCHPWSPGGYDPVP
ncbi:membrane protein insertion efficiency factor YidD [bacterium]|nr:membrane protein insertion efficiency factor YidD [bacterium]